jgi:hypothetical protein
MKRKNKFSSTFTKLKSKRNFQTIHTLIERYSKGWYLRYIEHYSFGVFFAKGCFVFWKRCRIHKPVSNLMCPIVMNYDGLQRRINMVNNYFVCFSVY